MRGKPVNHLLHLILTIVTVGLWGIVWIIVALTGGERRMQIAIDEYGNVVLTDVGREPQSGSGFRCDN